MTYSDEMRIWDSAVISISNVKHGLLVKQEITDILESSAFLYVVGENGRITLDAFSYPVTSNCLVHIGANKQITICSEAGELEYCIVMYHAELSPAAGRKLLSEMLYRNPFTRCFVLRTSSPLYFSEQFTTMTNEWSRKTPMAMLNMKRSFYSVLCRAYTELSMDRAEQVSPDAFEYVYQYLQQNHAEPVLIQELSDSLGIARSTIHKQFKDRIGISPQQYLTQLRLDAACRLLETGQVPLDEIAVSCGLRDKSYLTRVFKKKYGLPPGAYRKAHAKHRDDVVVQRAVHLPEQQQRIEYTEIESLGRVHRYFDVPQRIVCLNYSAAELCVALGLSDRITGVASAEEALSDCAKKYRREIAKAPFLRPYSPGQTIPSFQAVCDCKPDVVIGTGYSFNRYSGVADAEDFEALGIHVYAMKATYTLNGTFESVYEDIRKIGAMFGKAARAEELIRDMKAGEGALESVIEQHGAPIRVFSFDSADSDKALTCGQSLESHMIRAAGGVNVFGEREGQFVAVDWREVGAADPQIILVHYFHTRQDGLQKIALLKQIPEIAHTEAVRNDRIYMIGIKKVFPGIGNVETARRMAEVFRGMATSF